MKPRLIQAFFNGSCRVCGKKVLKGEQAWFAKHYGIRCQACGPHTTDDAPLPSRKGKKATSASRITSALDAMNRTPVAPVVPAARTEPTRGAGFAPTYAPAALKGTVDRGPDGVGRLMWS